MGYYEIRTNDYQQQAIFDVYTNVQISMWWSKIYDYGLVEGTSEYYVAQNEDRQQAIFHKDEPYIPLSQWLRRIIPYYGLLQGQSHYYIGVNKDGEQAVFHIDNPDAPISRWWYQIYKYGLVNGESDYYIAYDQYNAQHAIFHIGNPDEPVSQWWDDISPVGVVNGTTLYYAAISADHSHIDIYHLDNPFQPAYTIPKELGLHIILHVDSEFALYIYNNRIMLHDATKQKSQPIALVPENIQFIIEDMSLFVEDDYIVYSYIYPNQSVSKFTSYYINNKFLPIAVNSKYYICDLEGNIISEFNNINDAQAYILQHINGQYTYDMIRLY